MRGPPYLVLACAVVVQAQSSLPSPSATRLQYDQPSSSTVEPGGWRDFYLIAAGADADGQNLAFEVEAETWSPAGVSVYAFDGGLEDYAGPTSLNLHPAGPPEDVAALDADTVSHIGNSTHRRYFVYVGECYQMKGGTYYVSVYGLASTAVPITVTARRMRAALTTPPSLIGSATGSVCDGKYLHYFWDMPTVPSSGGVLATVEKTSGELDSFFVRKERCAGTGDHLASVSLNGHGLATGSVKLPSSVASLSPGRYYISIRGSADLCGTYNVGVRNLTASEYRTAMV